MGSKKKCEHCKRRLQLLIDLSKQLCDKCKRGKGLYYHDGRYITDDAPIIARVLRDDPSWFRVRHTSKIGQCYANCDAAVVWRVMYELYPKWFNRVFQYDEEPDGK